MESTIEGDIQELLSGIFNEEANRQDQSVLPQVPTLTAETTAGFVADTEELMAKQNHFTTAWKTCMASRRALYQKVQAIADVLFGNDALNRSDLQVIFRKMLKALHTDTENLDSIMADSAKMIENYAVHIKSVSDVLLHRPSQMALLGPGEQHRIPVTTPTLGEECDTLDDVRNLHLFGLRLSSV
jgi:hypothetical protein